MISRIPAIAVTLAPLSAGAAAAPGPDTGVAVSAPALTLVGIAAALVLALLLRPRLAALGGWLARRTAARRIAGELDTFGAGGVLRDFILPGAYGGLIRIDYAVLTASGIVCILVNGLSGRMQGGADAPQWTCLRRGRRQSFLNPIVQNAGQVRALQNAVAGLPVTGVVVFAGNVEFAAPRPENVVLPQELGSRLAGLEAQETEIEDPDAAWLRLKSAMLTDDDSRKDFAAQLTFG